MLNTADFVSHLIEEGFSDLCVVPCSFAKNLINETLNRSSQINYIPCASEAVACSIAAGLSISGKKPIVIIQSSGLTNMGSCITSLLKPYGIMFPIIVSWRSYKEGDSEIQHSHLAKSLPNLIEAYGYKYCLIDKVSLPKTVEQINSCLRELKICILEKDTFSKVDLNKEFTLDLSTFPRRSEYLQYLNNQYKASDKIFIGTTGNTSREMYTFMQETSNFYMAGNMGGALSLGLGAALAGKEVVICGGDAEFVMHLGGLATVGRYNNSISGSLDYIVFDNESNKSTGGQNTYQKHLNYTEVARSSGLSIVEEVICSIDKFEDALNSLNNKNINFLYVKCSYDVETPRPPMNIVKDISAFKNK